ncbi:MAG: hypothetical protein JNK65_10085, partial [Deltaproteobacteria bacterium]|nr:hypothetical protein [Deltaproteobacteria bacterium]
ANVLHEALGFFGSKIINHHRKCSHEKDFESLLLYFRNSGKKVPKDRILEREIAMDVLALKKMEKKKQLISNAQVMQQNITLFFGVTHALGYMLGDRLYYGLLSHAVKKSEIRDLFFDAFQKEGEPGEVYLRLLKKLSKVKLPKRV